VGDLTTARIMIERGAYFKGAIEIARKVQPGLDLDIFLARPEKNTLRAPGERLESPVQILAVQPSDRRGHPVQDRVYTRISSRWPARDASCCFQTGSTFQGSNRGHSRGTNEDITSRKKR
jgi:hypothetical protein